MVEKWKKLTLTLFTVVFLLLIFIVNNVEAINRTSKVVKVGMFKLEGIAEFNNKSIYQNYADKYFSKLTNITGLKFEYVIGSRNEIMKKFAKGELDGVFGVNYNKIYNRKYAYIKPGVFTKNIDLIGLKEGSEKYNSYNKQIDESIAGKVFGVISQYNENYRELLKENIDEKKEFKLNYYKTNANALKALRNHKIDYIIDTSYIYLANDLKKVGTLAQAKYYLITNKNDEELINILTNATLELELNGSLTSENSIDKYNPVLNIKEARALEKTPILTFYVAKNNSFYYKENKDGSITGFYAKYMKSLAKTLHKEYEVIQIEPKDLAKQKKAGLYFDVLRSYKYLPDSYGSKELTAPIIKTQVLFVVKKQVKSFENSKDSVVYVSCDPGYLKMFVDDGYKTILTENDKESLKLVANNKANVAIINFYSGHYLNSMARYKGLRLAGIEGNISRALLLVNSNDANLLSAINKAIASIPKRDFRVAVSKESKKHNYEPSIQEVIKNNFAIVILIILVIFIFGFLVIKVLLNKNRKIEKLANDVSKASSVKDDFLSRMSHDMRTPLNAIISYSNFGLEESENIDNKEYFKNIRENSLSLLNLMKDVLELQRINNLGKEIDNVRQVVDLKDHMNKLYKSFLARAKEKQIEFVFKEKSSENSLEYIKVDQVLLNKVLANILSNAFKYTPIGGKVKLGIEFIKIGENLRIKYFIEDNGLGISEDFQKIMFDTFTVSNNTLTNNTNGTGLGLAISKNAVEILGGSIKCKSVLGLGTTFIITIPIQRATKSEIQEYQMNYKKANLNLKKVEENYSKLDKIKVLLCEDQVINAKIIEKILSANKIEVVWAKNGALGIELLKKVKFDLILMDLRMPVMDGLTATREIRKMDLTIPIIGLSGISATEDIKIALEAGMNDYLEKPVDKNKLLEKIIKLINK